MALAVAGLRQRWHSQHRLDHTDRRLSESLGEKHGVATTVKDNRPDSEAKSNSQSSVLHGKLSPERVRGREAGRDWVRGRKAALPDTPPSTVESLPLSQWTLWRAWNQCSRLALAHDAVVHAFTKCISAPATQLRLTARPADDLIARSKKQDRYKQSGAQAEGHGDRSRARHRQVGWIRCRGKLVTCRVVHVCFQRLCAVIHQSLCMVWFRWRAQ